MNTKVEISRTMDLMIVPRHQITILEHLVAEEVERQEVKAQDILKKARRILILHKLLDQYTILKMGILHTNLRLHRQEAINVSAA